MKFGRRAFLQFAAGVVGGTLLSPLPWRLADDSAIWTQNWFWRPSPERGPVSKVATTCVFCDGGCGIQARLVNKNRAILLEGSPDHPINGGGVCPLCAAGLQFLYAPYRISQPMKQTRSRGDISGFQKITWNEAIIELSNRLGGLRSEGKANSLACITTQRQNSMDDLWQQFMTAYGSPNLFKMPSHTDSLKLAASLATGREDSLAFALERASYILSFGTPLIEGWGAAGRMQAAYGEWRRDTSEARAVKLVQVESRCSTTATKADRWVAVAPGAEAALALGMAHVLIKENLFDAAFMETSVFGFDDWTDAEGKQRQGFRNLVLSTYAPEQVAERTGVDSSSIRELAMEFAREKDAIVVWAGNQAGVPNNIYHDLVFFSLNVLKGNLKSDGLMMFAPSPPLGSLPEVQLDETARTGLEKGRLDLAQPRKPVLPGNGLYGFLDTLAKGAPYPISVLMVHEANPAYCLPDNRVFHSAMQNLGWIVSFSSYMDETAVQADLILPNPTALERYDDVIGLPGAPYPYYAVASPILPPQRDTRKTGDVILELAKSLGGAIEASLPWNTYEAYLQERVKGLASSGKGAVADKPRIALGKLRASESPKPNYKDAPDLWKKLASGMCWYDAPADPSETFQTQSRKIELACRSLQQKGLISKEDQVYLPHFVPLMPSGSETEYPLLLVSYQTLSLADKYLANPPFMTKTLWDFVLKGDDGFLEINPQTAKSMGMSEGDQILLKTPQGEVSARVHFFPGARPGVIYMIQGLGHTAYDEYIQLKGANVNNVIEVQMDPITGLGTVWATRAQLRRA